MSGEVLFIARSDSNVLVFGTLGLAFSDTEVPDVESGEAQLGGVLGIHHL